MLNSRSFSSQILKIFLPVSMGILLLCITVSLIYFFRIRQIMTAGTDEIIRKATENTKDNLCSQAKDAAKQLVKEKARNIEAGLIPLHDNLREMGKLIRWLNGRPSRIVPTQIPLPREIEGKRKGCILHMTTPDGTRDLFHGTKIPDWHLLEPLFATYRELNPEIRTIYFTSADGYTIDYDDIVQRKRGIFDGRKRPWYMEAIKNNGITFSNPYEDIYRRGLTVTASSPCFSEDNKLIGVVGLDYNIRKIYHPLQEEPAGVQYDYLLLDRTGKLMVSSKGFQDPREISAFLNSMSARILRWESGDKELESPQGGTNYVFWYTVKPAGWKLVLVKPESRITESAESAGARMLQIGRRNAANTEEDIRSAAAYLIVMFLCTIVLMVVVSFRLAERLGKPICELNESLKEMRRTGKFETDLQRQDELGALTRTLNEFFSDWKEEREDRRKLQKK